MNDELFDELVDSINADGSYLRGEQAPARVIFHGEPDPKAIRTRLDLTQEEFAAALCISVETLRNWEQGRREPSGSAKRPGSITSQCLAPFPSRMVIRFAGQSTSFTRGRKASSRRGPEP